jgi:hypothetical protein
VTNSTETKSIPLLLTHPKIRSIAELEQTHGRHYGTCVYQNKEVEVDHIIKQLAGKKNKIPKIIHQIWIGSKTIPKWINSFKSFAKTHLGWKYKLWTDMEVSTFKMNFTANYKSEPTLNGKSDILRYELLYKFGGIYIDADSEWLGTRDLQELIINTGNSGVFAAYECQSCKLGLASGVIGSSVKNPIIYHTMKIADRKCQVSAFHRVGNWLLDQTFNGFNVTIFPYDYFYPIHWHGLQSYNINIEKQRKMFPNSFMTQYGYTTNNMQ